MMFERRSFSFLPDIDGGMSSSSDPLILTFHALMPGMPGAGKRKNRIHCVRLNENYVLVGHTEPPSRVIICMAF